MATLDMRPAKGASTEEKESVETVEEIVETEEKETPAETSTAEKPDETAVPVEESASEKTEEPQQVEEEKRIIGLKAEEERLRKQIEQLRGERRAIRQEQRPQNPLIVPNDDLKDVAPQDIEVIEKVLRAKGYVRKEEISSMTYTEKLESAKDSWLKEHPEYLPANDTDDVKWSALNETIKNYFKAPPKPEDVVKVMDLAHQMIGGAPKQSLPTKTAATTAASQEKVKSLSKGTGGSAGSVTPAPRKNIDTSYLIGFSDVELEEMKSG